ncbi:S-layer homology domain-containing protein [Paenibacillus bouchesdurhonensis]|uniref:S-layer homology domain-containing protein n=1 Tax=Paenibacillus bouchesdurhonensis TaxID=1870990 RepID=UPI000DA623BD|nr:S-layer homology domain-containing protein [Paenibacillus bouchesdurhonensis]
MSNTSYSFKENSHMKDIQGGEKKVMKKILSVALSTAMAFSMFASVAFSADAKLTPQQQFDALKSAGIVTGYPDGTAGLDKSITRAELATIIVKAIDLEPVTGVATYKDKNYDVNHWAAKYIEAATQAGILTGKDAVKQLFGPSDNLTVQELAVVLVKALGLEVPAETDNTATEWAKGYVQAAIDAGLLESGINYQANATRSQVVVAAHATYEANQVPTVASYTVSEAGKVVEFKLSNDEVVKVTLEEALAPNKETEVKFTHNGAEYTHKVTYVTTVAQTVRSVSAADLKQVVVEFDGTVDVVSAGLKDNYSVDGGKKIDKVTVSEDKTSATILLAEADNATLKNQKEVELKIKNVKNEDGTKTFEQTIKFVPSDVTAPTIKEVVGLGTKAFKVKFSEPIKGREASISSNFKIDGKAVGAYITYSYPDTVIVSTNLTEGEHKVSVSNVEDFSGLKVAPVENDFTVVVDNAAPEIVSVKANDLREVVVTFDETVKSVESAYANVSSRKATSIEIRDNVVTLRFDNKDQPLNYGENTIHLTGVSDYSDNKTDRDVKVTPELDTIRPTVVGQELKTEDGFIKLVINFSETLNRTKAEDRDNYVLKNADGKVADKSGVNADGKPVYQPIYNSDDKTVTLNLGSVGSLDDNTDYIVSISNLTDDAYVPNTILPVDVQFNTKSVAVAGIDRVWVQNVNSNESYIFVQFNRSVKVDGEGSALQPEKYVFAGSGKAVTTDKNDVVAITSDVIRITAKTDDVYSSVAANTLKESELTISYVADVDGKYFVSGNSYHITKDIKSTSADILGLDKAEAKTRKEIKLSFNGKLSTTSRYDFVLVTGSGDITPATATLSGDQKSVTLTFDDKVIKADASNVQIKTASNVVSQDSLGNKLSFAATTLIDDIRPELEFSKIEKVNTVTNATYYDITLTSDEDIKLSGFSTSEHIANNLFKVKFNEAEAKAIDGSTAFEITGPTTAVLRVYVTESAKTPDNGDFTAANLTITFDGDKNDSSKALVDNGVNAKPVNKLNVSRNVTIN